MYWGYGWQALADWLVDVLWYAMWFLYGGLVAFGSFWYVGYGGYRAWQEWDRGWLRRREERRINREVAHGLRQVEDFLRSPSSSPATPSDEP